MSGTIVISRTSSIDVRTVDFLRLVDTLRGMNGGSETVARLLECFDEYGMNLICADELGPAGLREFNRLIQEIALTVPGRADSWTEYLNRVHSLIISDDRYLEP